MAKTLVCTAGRSFPEGARSSRGSRGTRTSSRRDTPLQWEDGEIVHLESIRRYLVSSRRAVAMARRSPSSVSSESSCPSSNAQATSSGPGWSTSEP